MSGSPASAPQLRLDAQRRLSAAPLATSTDRHERRCATTPQNRAQVRGRASGVRCKAMLGGSVRNIQEKHLRIIHPSLCDERRSIHLKNIYPSLCDERRRKRLRNGRLVSCNERRSIHLRNILLASCNERRRKRLRNILLASCNEHRRNVSEISFLHRATNIEETSPKYPSCIVQRT